MEVLICPPLERPQIRVKHICSSTQHLPMSFSGNGPFVNTYQLAYPKTPKNLPQSLLDLFFN